MKTNQTPLNKDTAQKKQIIKIAEVILDKYDKKEAWNKVALVSVISAEIESLLEQERQKVRVERDVAVDALVRIDDIVSSDPGFEADCYLAINKLRGEDPRPEQAKDWAEMIVNIYLVTHKLLHTCCGGKLSQPKKEQDV